MNNEDYFKKNFQNTNPNSFNNTGWLGFKGITDQTDVDDNKIILKE